MTRNTFKHLARLAPVLAALVIAIGSAQPASAATCNQDLGGCYQQAAGIDGFWARTAAAYDCDVTYGLCVLQGLAF